MNDKRSQFSVMNDIVNDKAGADLGFPVGGGSNPPGEGANIHIFPQKTA